MNKQIIIENELVKATKNKDIIWTRKGSAEGYYTYVSTYNGVNIELPNDGESTLIAGELSLSWFHKLRSEALQQVTDNEKQAVFNTLKIKEPEPKPGVSKELVWYAFVAGSFVSLVACAILPLYVVAITAAGAVFAKVFCKVVQ